MARLAAILIAAAIAGCGGGTTSPERPASRLIGPGAFASEVARPGTVTLNVHVPDAGSLPGTDLAIPYDRITARAGELPDRSTPLAVYCRSGRMSALAVKDLRRLGYRNVVELRGGMEAWTAAGRRLLPAAR